MKKVIIDSGVQEYSLNDKCSVFFNPADTEFADRIYTAFEELRKKQEKRTLDLEKMTTRETFDYLKQLDREMRDTIDGVFGQPVCEPLFGSMSVYASAGGTPVITLQKTTPAMRRAKIDRIIFGVERIFAMTELRKASITNEMDESCIELPISTFAWTLDSLSSVDYMFQLKQPVEVRNNESLLGVYYINGASRAAERVYDIDCHDALGVLSESQFAGGAYLSGASAKSLLETLCAPFSVEYAEGVIDAILKGVLEPQPKRDAIRQVVFAWGVCLATDGGSTIRVFTLPKTAKAIPKASTLTGASVETTSVVTAVKLTAHTYAEDNNGGVTINGQSYSDTESVYTVSNPNVTASDRQNIIEITGATLVSTDAAQAVAQRVYDYYQKRDTISAKIVYGGEKLGDALRVYTPWDTLVSGNLSKMGITLSNTVVYKAEVTGA